MRNSFFGYRCCRGRVRSVKNRRRASGRLKDLPNISFHMELQLIHAGIPDVRTLREVALSRPGKATRNNASLSLNVLLALEGRLSAFMPPRSRRHGVRSCSNGRSPLADSRLFCLSVDPLLQAADFRQQRQQQANLL
jgi:hypothetical protein